MLPERGGRMGTAASLGEVAGAGGKKPNAGLAPSASEVCAC